MKYSRPVSNGTTKYQQERILADLTRQAGLDPDYGIGIRSEDLMLPDAPDHGEYAPDVQWSQPESGIKPMPSQGNPNAGK